MKKITRYAIVPVLVLVAFFFIAAKSGQHVQNSVHSSSTADQVMMDFTSAEAELTTPSEGEPVAATGQATTNAATASTVPASEAITAPVAHKLTLKEKVAAKIMAKKVKKELKKNEAGKTTGGKSQLVALLLAIFLGGLGIHRFYLGYTGIGVIQLLTAGGCGIWALIDIIRIATGDLQPKDGPYAETL